MGIQAEIQKLNQSALIDLIEVDATAQGGDVFYFHAGTNELGGDVVWQGITYIRLPVEADGFAQSSTGTLPRPTLRVSNIDGLMAAEARQFNYFLGAKVTRRRTLARFLDAVNFENGNPDADPTQALPDEIWFVDRKSVESRAVLEFELASAMDLYGIALPRRQVIQNTCTWRYRDSNCNYSGPPVATAQGVATTDPALDQCGKNLESCKLRFGVGILPFGAFPSTSLLR